MLFLMPFSPTAYGPAVAAILALDGNGERLMPLASGTCSSPEALNRLRAAELESLFPRARAPRAALAGLYLYFSCLEESHATAQQIDNPEGSFWHAIMHRQEPDPGNSAHWFRRVGRHPLFPSLREQALSIGFNSGAQWNPFAFIEYAERARTRGGTEERIALEVQRAEWRLLFDYCARPPAVEAP
jgi:hypothetical protein